LLVIPAKAGIQLFVTKSQRLDSGFRRNDEVEGILRAPGNRKATRRRQRPQVVDCRGMDALAAHGAGSERRKTLIGRETSLRRW
jgi:hypothetical protein